MAIASDYMFREQLRTREMEEMARCGYLVPVPQPMRVANYNDGCTPDMPIHDELRYNPHSMTYETRHQSQKIQELEHKLAFKELTKVSEENTEKNKLENLIAYYYNR